MRIDDNIVSLLAGATITGNSVSIGLQVAPEVWQSVAEVFTALGGRYRSGSRSYVFEADPTSALALVIASGTVETVRVGEGYVPTPEAVAEELCAFPYGEIGRLPAGARVLEPSAGGGQIVRAILAANPAVCVTAVEPNVARSRLIGTVQNVEVVNSTFEAHAANAAGGFDAIVMNPPFSVSGNKTIWMDHVDLAWSLLRPGGRLVAIVPDGFHWRSGQRYEQVRKLVNTHGGYDRLAGDEFGGVKVVVLRLTKPLPTSDGRAPYVFRSYPAGIVPVRVTHPQLTAAAAESMPVQVWGDTFGGEDRVLRFHGQCHGCGWLVWLFASGYNDPCGPLGDYSGHGSIDADEFGMVGPSVALCSGCASTSERVDAAEAAARTLWTTPEEAGTPVVEDAGVPQPTPWDQLLLTV